MKQCKLIVHTKDFNSEDLIVNPKDFPEAKSKDIFEIYHQDEKFSRLLLQVNSLSDLPQTHKEGTISVETNVATTFQLRTYADVFVRLVNPESVALDSVELTFKDQYLERGDMWRLKRNMGLAAVQHRGNTASE